MLDPKTKKYTFVETCYSTHHPQFGYDANDTLWTSGGGPVVGWLNTKMFDQTGDAAKSQGWTALVLDTNGNGKRDAYIEPDQPPDPTKDTRINSPFYAVMPSPVDGSIWGATLGVPGAVVRLAPGSNPPETALAEIYNVPLPGFGARGADIDSKGVVWVSLGSGHIGSFDRRKCKGPLNGPKATGDHCPEGWSFHQYPGPGFQGIGENSAESSYYSWVDQHNTFGLGNDVPMSTGNLNDGLIAYANGRMVVLRVPYPMGFYAKGFDGRIDDPKAGWKGRGLWAANGDRTPWLIEGGKGTSRWPRTSSCGRIRWRSSAVARLGARWPITIRSFSISAGSPGFGSPQSVAPPTPGQPGKDVVWVPTSPELVEKMLDMAEVTPNDFVIDLGSGDGRNVIAAAKRGARALGVEYNPDLVELSGNAPRPLTYPTKRRSYRATCTRQMFRRRPCSRCFSRRNSSTRMTDKFLAMKPGPASCQHVSRNRLGAGRDRNHRRALQGRGHRAPGHRAGACRRHVAVGRAQMALRQDYQFVTARSAASR